MLSKIQQWFGKTETALVFNLVFNRDQSGEAFGKSTGEMSSCHSYVALKEYQWCLGEATGEAVGGKSLPPNCQENTNPLGLHWREQK